MSPLLPRADDPIARKLAVLAGLVAAAVLLAGCETGSTWSAPDGGMAAYSTNLLQQGDVVSISFQYSSNFSCIQKIPLDGFLNLEGVGPVKAAGASTTELQQEVARKYQPQTKDDVVTVKLISVAAGVYVAGAVFRPGKIPLDHPMTVLQAVIEAGGYDPNRAKLSEVTVLRIEDGRQRTYRVDLGRILKGKEVLPFYLQPFDVVHVPIRMFNL